MNWRDIYNIYIPSTDAQVFFTSGPLTSVPATEAQSDLTSGLFSEGAETHTTAKSMVLSAQEPTHNGSSAHMKRSVVTAAGVCVLFVTLTFLIMITVLLFISMFKRHGCFKKNRKDKEDTVGNIQTTSGEDSDGVSAEVHDSLNRNVSHFFG